MDPTPAPSSTSPPRGLSRRTLALLVALLLLSGLGIAVRFEHPIRAFLGLDIIVTTPPTPSGKKIDPMDMHDGHETY